MPVTTRVKVTPEMALIELSRRRCEASLAQFSREAFSVIEPETQYVHGWHIDVICAHLEALVRGEIRNLVINMPPRHMKSYLCSVFLPAWVWLQSPGKQFLYSSYAQSLSYDHSLKCKRLIESDWFVARWGSILTDERKQVSAFGTRSGGMRIASSVGGAATGKGCDIAVNDDPHNVKERESDRKREGVIDHWNSVISTRGNNPKTFCRLVVMQRVHDHDLSGELIKEGYATLILPARWEGQATIGVLGHVDPRTRTGEPLWPARYDDAELVDLEKHLGPYGAAGQLQQRPAPAGGGLFRIGRVRYYSRRIRDLLMEPGHIEQWCTSWDMSNQLTDDGSHSCGQVWGRRGADVFLFDRWSQRCDIMTRCNGVRLLALRYPQAVPRILENKSTGPAVEELLAGEVPGIILVEPSGSKEDRAEAVSNFWHAGNIWVPHPDDAPWVMDFLKVHELFPNYGGSDGAGKDDDVDCMSQALWHLYFDQGGEPEMPQGKLFRSDVVQAGLPRVELQLREARARGKAAQRLRRARQLGRAPQDGSRTMTGPDYDDPWAVLDDDA